MDSTYLFHSVALFFHVLGLGLLGGALVCGPIAHRMLFSSAEGDRRQVEAGAALHRLIPIVAQAGSILMLLSGLGLLAAAHWAYWGTTWLSVKLGLYVALVLNGAVVARKAGVELHNALPAFVTASGPGTALSADLVAIRQRLFLFHASETVMFVLVLLLAVFKP